jgi:hypothetical protein
MGTLTDGPSALARALDVLKTEYGSEDYNILTRYGPHPDVSDIEWGRSPPTPPILGTRIQPSMPCLRL